MPIDRAATCLLAVVALAAATNVCAADLTVALAPGAPEIMYRSDVDRCTPIDTPDIDPRAYRDADGGVDMFALHYVNRALRGPDLSHLKIDCSIALDSHLDPDPSHHDDRLYMTATWTNDGRRVVGIVHSEYHADDHKRCAVASVLGCWFNSVLSFSSFDSGHTFKMDNPAVVASAPFTQDVEQGRHRGFFNPSNIFSDGRYEYFFASTTGWTGQDGGACLFRSANPFSSASWRAWDGSAFSIGYVDPYRMKNAHPRPCAPIAPFGLPVGSVTRHDKSGRWLAVWMAPKGGGATPIAGFYASTSTNLLEWTEPRLLMAGRVIHDMGCGAPVIAYPSLIDENSKGRNFDHIGDAPWLYYVAIRMEGCNTGVRTIARQRLHIVETGGAHK